MRALRPGGEGDAVRDVQSRLAALGYRIDPEEAGRFGPATERVVREFQQRRGLVVDGIVGVGTWSALVEAGYALGDRTLYLHQPFLRGDDVRALQSRLNAMGFDPGREDGIFGERTDRALREFQRNVGLPADGIVGLTTVEAVGRLRPVGEGPGKAAVRESEALRGARAGLDGALIGVDPGHGPDEPGGVGPTGLTEADATALLGEALAGELRRRGGRPVVLRRTGDDPSIRERAVRANEDALEVVVSIHCNTHPSPDAEGASCYYFGTEGSISRTGERLAEYIQEELVGRTGVVDGRVHAKAFPMLVETRMPAVQVEPCFITNPREEALLREEAFRRDVAIAIAEGVRRYFSAGEDAEARTG
ncbi:MAG TPA: peptidoglycan-binding protein [Actinomycetota bacterium]|nr:peptidoglycan-binding protein [Actinomycetota bacterium]